MTELLADLMTAERARSGALCSRDIGHLESCLDPGFLYVHGSGQIDDRATYIASQISRTAEFTSFAYENEQAVDHGSWAVLTGIVTMHYILNEAPQSRRYRFISSWDRRGSDWSLCHWQNTGIAE